MGSSPRSYSPPPPSEHLFTLYRSVTQNLFDVRRSTFENGAVQIYFITEIAHVHNVHKSKSTRSGMVFEPKQELSDDSGIYTFKLKSIPEYLIQ